MSLSVLFEALTANPSATVKSCLMAIHLIGLSFGMGAATLLDLVIVRFLVTRKVTNDYCQIVEFSSKLVTAGLILLWLTGMGFLIFYVVSDPVKLTNQKIWAKMIIVSILTLNGVFIHRTVLPLVRTQIGRSLFDGLMARERSMLLASGAVSVTSWYIPMVLGVFPQLNFLPAIPILLIYGLLLAVAIIATQSFGVISARRESRQRVQRALDSLGHVGALRPVVSVVAADDQVVMQDVGRAIAQYLMAGRGRAGELAPTSRTV
jgi:hypothetical protein